MKKYVGDLCQKKTFTPDYLTHQRNITVAKKKKDLFKRPPRGRLLTVICGTGHRQSWSGVPCRRRRNPGTAAATGAVAKFAAGVWQSVCKQNKETADRYIQGMAVLSHGDSWCTENSRRRKKLAVIIIPSMKRHLLTCMKYCVNLICQDRKQLRQRKFFPESRLFAESRLLR